MARVFTDGAEMGDVRFWDYASGFVVADTTPVPLGGLYSYKGAYLGAHKLLPTPLTDFYMRYHMSISDVPQAHEAYIFGFRNDTYNMARLSVDGLGRFCVYRGSTVIETSSFVPVKDTWYLIELHFVLSQTVGVFNVYVDGTEIIDFTGDTNPTAAPDERTTIDNIYFSTNAYVAVSMDDLALNDTTGGVDDGWCGDGIIVKMTPNDNGAHNNWHGSDSDDADNYLLVDEYPNDGDLTYVYRDGADTGTQDQYKLTDLDCTNKTILRIYPEARARKTAAAAYTLKLGILPSGGVDQMSAARTLNEDIYQRIVGDEYLVNPVDSNPWEEADLAALEFVAEVG